MSRTQIYEKRQRYAMMLPQLPPNNPMHEVIAAYNRIGAMLNTIQVIPDNVIREIETLDTLLEAQFELHCMINVLVDAVGKRLQDNGIDWRKLPVFQEPRH